MGGRLLEVRLYLQKANLRTTAYFVLVRCFLVRRYISDFLLGFCSDSLIMSCSGRVSRFSMPSLIRGAGFPPLQTLSIYHAYTTRKSWARTIGHFCLCVQTSRRAKLFILKCVPPRGSFSCKSNSSGLVKIFARGLVLKQRQGNLEMAYS